MGHTRRDYQTTRPDAIKHCSHWFAAGRIRPVCGPVPVNERGIDCDYWTAHRAVAKGTAAQNFYTPSALFSGARAGGNGEF